MKAKVLAAVIAAAAAASPAVAGAATITQTFSFSGTTDWTQPATLNLFNPALGTLDSVTAAANATVAFSGSATNTGTGRAFWFYDMITALELSGGPAPLASLYQNPLAEAYTGSMSCYSPRIYDPTFSNVGTGCTAFNPSIRRSVAGGATDSYGTTVTSASLSTYTSASDLAAFIGAGIFTTDFSALAEFVAGATGGNTNVSLATTAGFDLTLTYDYTVPEPMSGMLLAGSLAGLGAVRRRRAHSG